MATRTRLARSTRKPRHDKPAARVTVLLGLLVTGLLVLLGWQALRLYSGVPTTNYVTQYASVPTIGNLLSHDFVRIGGRRVGQVLKVDVGEDGRPLVELQLDPGTKLPEDTTIAVRANGLLGARYVALNPGTSARMLPEGSTIRGGAKAYTFGLPETVETFDDETRHGLKQTIGGLAEGVLRNGEALNATIVDARQGAPQFSDVVQAILDRDGAAARFLPAFESAFNALEPTKPYVAPGSQAFGDALQPFITQREATRDTIAEAPPMLSAMTAGLPRGEQLLAAVRDFSTAAADTLPPAPRAFSALNRALDIAPHTLRRLEPTLRPGRLPRTVLRGPVQVLQATKRIGVLGRVDRLLDLVHTPLAEVARRSCDIKNFAAVMRSMTGFSQAGHGPLGPAMAFRLAAVVPGTVGTLGIADPNLKRSGSDEVPCTYLSTPYPQFANLVPQFRGGGR